MIQSGSRIKIKDNSGAKEIKIIKFYKKTPYSSIKVGNIFIGSIKNIKLKRKSKIKKLQDGDLKKSILIRHKLPIKRRDGSVVRFFENASVLIDNKQKPIATRVKGFIPYEIKTKKNLKLIFISAGVIF